MTNIFKCKRIKHKINLLFLTAFILPMAALMYISLSRISSVAETDRINTLKNSLSLYRQHLDNHLRTLRIRAKTMADFDLYESLQKGFDTASLTPMLQYELTKSGLDYIALVSDRTMVRITEGNSPLDSIGRVLIPTLCDSGLNSSLYIINDKAWMFASAQISKLHTDNVYHVVFAQQMPADFADSLSDATGAKFSLIYGTKQVASSKMDIYNKRQINIQVPDAEAASGTTEIMTKKFYFVRDAALPGQIDSNIRVEIDVPESSYALLFAKIGKDFIIFSLIGLILASIGGYMLSNNISAPINKLADKTTKVASGDLTVEGKIDRIDEIGILDNNFREMIKSIKSEREQKEQHMSELNTLFAISNAVNYFTDSEELLKFILTHAIEVLKAERGSIMLLDDKTDELVIKVASGGRYRAIQSKPVKPGEGICGLVAQTGKGIICNDGFKDSRFKNLNSILPVEDIITLICAPLKFKDGTIGVINIVNKVDGGIFNSNDLAMLNLIGSQAAITIENNKLYELSITDGLTKLFVHRYFQARLSEEVLRARRYNLELGLLMVDIDNFKKFNDTYGHQIGDTVLQKVASTIKETVRAGVDIPCRYGGEEMTVILPETNAEKALHTAERIRQKISLVRIPHESGDLQITVSIGVSAYPALTDNKDDLIKQSDTAMYVSKGTGKNRATLYTPEKDSEKA